MDIFAIIVLVTIILDFINKMRKKEKDNRQPPPVRVAQKTAEELAGELRETLRHARIKQPGLASVTTMAKDEQSRELISPGATVILQSGPLKTEAKEKTAIGFDLERMLGNPDNLVAGFIFHEILERPRALRRR